MNIEDCQKTVVDSEIKPNNIYNIKEKVKLMLILHISSSFYKNISNLLIPKAYQSVTGH